MNRQIKITISCLTLLAVLLFFFTDVFNKPEISDKQIDNRDAYWELIQSSSSRDEITIRDSGSRNVAFGYNALTSMTGQNNVAIGYGTLRKDKSRE